MNAREFSHPETADLSLHRVLFALSDLTRLAIVSGLLRITESSSGDLLDGGVPKSTMTHHLKILREAGVTRTRPEGMRCMISLRLEDLEKRFPCLLENVMAHNSQDTRQR